MEHRNRNQDWVLLVVGIAIVWFGARTLLGALPVFEPIQRVFEIIRNIAFPLLLVAGGILLILFATRRDLFTRPDGRRLYRSRDQRVITGVLGGLSEFYGWDVTLVRVLYVIAAVITGGGFFLIAYIIASFAIPEAPPGASVVPPQWPQAGTYTPPPNPPQAPQPPQPYYPPPAPYSPPVPSVPPGPPTAPSVPEIPAPGAPVPPGQSYPPQASAPEPPAAPQPPVPPADEPTTPPTNG